MARNPDDITQPRDHLPPAEERDEATDGEEPGYPAADPPQAPEHASPATEAEPDKPKRHGVDKLPPGSA
ncbi:hypothetical protein [Microbacterium sp. SD291]|uniref:hypothetical protein n=1 Tax=Microbacterium sp. SD291 TaxID=2782007 RepID=UPI001A965826|nr:hypothetical protein [Microbacterium sp. SD291]MBO0980775.1 hypothetical protein [Microbacterium sp. SD291]